MWKKSVKDLDCKIDPTFCQSRAQCTKLAHKLQSVSFNIDGTMFELKPLAYLHQGPEICQFAIAENPLDMKNNGNFLFGSLFLKHFYSIYDFDNELISLGVNTHSKNVVSMHAGADPKKYNISQMGLPRSTSSDVTTVL